MFNDEFNSLPPLVRKVLEDRLEEVVRQIYRRCNTAQRDYTVPNYTGEQISAMIFSIFDTANRIQNKLQDPAGTDLA